MNFAIIGESTRESLSPKMHQWIFRSLGFEHRYEFIDITVNHVDNIVNKLRKQNLNGVNITIPFKSTFIDYLDDLDELAVHIGSINCIHSYNGILKGYNTDYYGFKSLISNNNIDLKNRKILVLGAGGASRSICTYLAHNNLKFSIFNRTYKNALSVIDKIGYAHNGEVIEDSISNIQYNIIINCLPLSVNISDYLQSIGYNYNLLDYYIDINYHINENIQDNIKAKFFINGLDMLIYQGIQSNEIWLQKDLEEKVDYTNLRNYLLGEQC